MKPKYNLKNNKLDITIYNKKIINLTMYKNSPQLESIPSLPKLKKPMKDKKIIKRKSLNKPSIKVEKKREDRRLSFCIDIEETKKRIKKEYLSLETFKEEYPDYIEASTSKKPFSYIKAYAMNTYKGIYRNYNEDRIIAKVNIEKPSENKSKNWPKISYFAVYDGHGGNECVNFLHKHLLHYILINKNFPLCPKEALLEAFANAEKDYMAEVVEITDSQTTIKDDSGSCACVALIVDSQCYIANLGDSRAIMSYDGGKKVKQISVNHKPEDPQEKKRIKDKGGDVYFETLDNYEEDFYTENECQKNDEIKETEEPSNHDKEEGVYRVLPGKLAVSRSIGDFSCKMKETGGIPGVISSIPDIFHFTLTSNSDFLLIGSDGIFDVLSAEEAIEAAWYADHYCNSFRGNLNQQCCYYVDNVLKTAMKLKSMDNLSCIIVGFSNLETVTNHKIIKDKVHKAMKANDIKLEHQKTLSP